MKNVLLVFDKDGYLLSAGDPAEATKGGRLTKQLKDGATCQTITIDEYKKQYNTYKWIWDKEETEPTLHH